MLPLVDVHRVVADAHNGLDGYERLLPAEPKQIARDDFQKADALFPIINDEITNRADPCPIFFDDLAPAHILGGISNRQIDHIDQGLTLVRIIEDAVPTYRVTARIQTGDTTYKDQEQVKQLMVPMYAELEKVTLMAPLMAAKKEAARSGGTAHPSRSGKQAQPSCAEQASPSSQAAMTPVVAGVEAHSTRIMLDVSAAEGHLQAAKRALNEDRYKAADGALAALQRGVTFAFVEVDLPLLRARENLMLAKTQMKAGEVQDAWATLEAAAQALETYAQQADKARASQVQSLQQEIENYAQQLPQQGQPTKRKSQQAAEQIDEWWDRIVQLSGQA
ncbi:MAG TPA: YfdX family protein [Alphaproteobacteria bacterium]|nr:YfdX family protein [Alphaproteobacteria bacterium]